MRRFMKLLLIPSGIAVMLSLSNADKNELLLFLLIGLIVGVLLNLSKVENRTFGGKVEKVIGIVLAFILCVLNSQYFFNTWAASSTLKSLLSHFFTTPETGLIVISVMVGLAGFPVLAYVTVIAVTWLVRMCKIIKIKKIINIVKEKTRLRTVLKSTTAVLLNLIVAAGLGTVLLLAVYSLPTDPIEEHVRSSAVTIQEEGTYPRLYSWCNSQLDNWTDSIMLLEAADATDASALEKAMLAYRGSINDDNPAETLVAHYFQNVEFTRTTDYARYWHGYLVALKPLLSFFDYSTIRIINGAVQLIALLLVCVLMNRKGLTRYIIPYILCYLMLMPIAMAKSFQFSSCYYVFTAGVIALLLLNDSARSKLTYLIFLNIGIMTAYADFLTYPIATFGIPAIVRVALRSDDHLEEKLIELVRNGLLWCLGYGGMWGAKWLIASITTGHNVFANAMEIFSFRTSTLSADGSTQYSVFNCEVMNYTRFIKTPFIILAIIFCVYVFAKHIRRHNFGHECVLATSLPYVIISFAPVVWYAFATNHSYIHYWFTNKACVVTLAALLFGITDVSHNILHKFALDQEPKRKVKSCKQGFSVNFHRCNFRDYLSR